jgi:G6PDH family F420-dependent oxidoreductase
MIRVGYKLMSEEHGPAALVRNAVRAEMAGFDFTAISDHFSPWLEEQGHAPFAWTVLGAIAEATHHIGLMVAVSCPIMRYHPAIVAQAAATLALLGGDRFTLGLGTGERLNEQVVGTGRPGIADRLDRLAEALEIINGLLHGRVGRFQGSHFRLDHARLFDRPDRPPPVVVAAAEPRAARLAATRADGIVSITPRTDLLQAYSGAGGKGPRYAEVAMCYGEDEKEAVKTAHRYCRWAAVGGPQTAELPNTEAFAAASKPVSSETVAEAISCGPSPDRHLGAIKRYLEAGYDHLILVQIGPDQEGFFEFFGRELAPRLRH